MSHFRNHSLAISTSASIHTSASPSPVSPASPASASAGLSRRHSWNVTDESQEIPTFNDPSNASRHVDDNLTPRRAVPLHSTPLGKSGTVHSHRLSERDIIWADVNDGRDIGGDPNETTPTKSHNRPFFDSYQSTTSLHSTISPLDVNGRSSDDRERLTTGPSHVMHYNGIGKGTPRRSPRKPYNESGSSLRRSSTLRNVSQSLRKASVRVVNIMGTERGDGRERLGSDDEGEEVLQDVEIDGDQAFAMSSTNDNPGTVPSPRQLPTRSQREEVDHGRLRGRTMCLFGPMSRVRKSMDRLMRYPWTEPVILLLIITNVVVLAIQSAPALDSPRIDNGYFQGWEDFVLLVLFIVFTLEMFARIVVTGLLLDPETSLRESLFGQDGAVPILKQYLLITKFNIQSNLRRNATKRRAPWRSQGQNDAAHNKDSKTPANSALRSLTGLSEAPFQKAMARQKGLSDQGRPYLRHSWHRIDMIAVFAFWITFFLALTGYEATADRHVYIFRALSVLRAGRLLVITSGTTTILHSLKRAGPMLITVSYFLVFAACIFSIIGVQSFRGSFRRACVLTDPHNSSNVIQLETQCGGWLDPTSFKSMSYLSLDGTSSAVPPKGYICPLGQICMTTDENPNNNVNSFDNVFSSLVQVIIVISINTWAPVMYMAMDSDFFGSSLFFIAGVIVLNFWLINLLIAVVVNTFSDIRAETKRSAFGAGETFLGTEPHWAAEDEKTKNNRLLAFYQKTEIFWVILVVADLVAQGSKSSSSPESMLRLLDRLELAFTLAFDLEIIIRFLAYFPDWRTFFYRKRNCFDLFLAIACSIIQIPAISNSPIYPWLTVFQLIRWYRVILAFPRMKPLLITVFGSFSGLLNMVIFLFLMNFLGALMALQLFRGDLEAGETITFSQTYNSFLGMYQIFSSENWTDIVYDTMGAESQYKQNIIAAIFLCGWFLFSNFIVLQMFIAVINENFAIAEEQKRKQQIQAFIHRAEAPSAHASWIDRLNPYRLMTARHRAVRVKTLPPNLILPLKQNVGIDVSDVPSSLPMNDGKSTKGAVKRLLGRDGDEDQIPLKRFKRPPPRESTDDAEDEDDDRGLTDLLPPLNAAVSTDEHMDAFRERRNQQADFIAAHPSFDKSLWLFKQNNPIRKFCQACVPSAYGERIFGRSTNPTLALIVKTVVFLAVVASIVVAAIASPSYRREYYADHGISRWTWFDLTEVALGLIFVLEAAMKIVADGFIFAPNAYLLSLWNVLDFIILITLLINITTSLIFIGGLSRVTRALKSFRALRLITLFGRLRDTLHAVLFAGALKILDASIFMILYLIPFAVWGLNIFSGLLYYCNDDDSSGLTSCIGEFSTSSIDDSLTYLVPRVWVNPTVDESIWSFDSFRESILILFEIVSLEGWIDVMASVMNIVGRDQQPQNQASQWNAIYLVIFNLFGGVIILTLFVSIIIKNFSTRSGNALLTSEQRQWVDLSKFIKAQTPSQLPKGRPRLPFRAWCYDRAVNKNGFWAVGFTMIYYLHILLLMMEDFSENLLNEVQLDWIFLFLTVLYAVDLLVRFYGLGFKSFKSNGWNIFDLIVITGSFATTIPALQADSSGGTANQANVQLQKLFLVSISLKLVQRISSLNQLFKTSVASLPAIGNLFLLWATIFIFYAILYLEVFGLTKEGNNAGTRFQNYYTFGNALLMLAFMSTGEGWNGYMHDYTIQEPRCTENGNFLESDCGSAPGAYVLFISWNIISMYIFVNMFTGVVVESFAYVYQMPGKSSLNREEMRAFKQLWAEFDSQRIGYIKRKDLIRFFSRLTGVFEVRPFPVEFGVHNIIRHSRPDQVDNNASSQSYVITGVKHAVDVRRVAEQIAQIDYKQVRVRRQLFSRLYNEARISEEPGKGISFTAMLMMLAHYKLIDDESALQLDDLLLRRAKTERVTDLVNLDRVRGLLRTIYWRKRFLATRDARKLTLNAEAEGIPAIVLDPTPITPPDYNGQSRYDTPYSPQVQEKEESIPKRITPTEIIPPTSFSPSARTYPLPASDLSNSSDGNSLPSPSLYNSPTRLTSRPALLGRQPSNNSHLSSDDAHYRRDSRPDEDLHTKDYDDDMLDSMWGDMMREAVDQEGIKNEQG
ncbi:high-affinity cell membrane calcium channel [Cryptococcus neoformans]|nr:high-affinity cell membrane calcium channel [Cryptococcus neoformans var. grubii]